MGKKCVQNVNTLRTGLGISVSYTHQGIAVFARLLKKFTHPHTFTQVFHKLILPYLICENSWFYPGSTMPTITTICLFNKKPVRI